MSKDSKETAVSLNNVGNHKLPTFENGLAEIVVKQIKLGELTYDDACKMATNGSYLFDYDIKGWGSIENQSKFLNDHHSEIIEFIKTYFGGGDIADIMFIDVVRANPNETEIGFDEVAKGIYETKGLNGELSDGREVVVLAVIDLLTKLVGKDYKAYFEITEDTNGDLAKGTFFE